MALYPRMIQGKILQELGGYSLPVTDEVLLYFSPFVCKDITITTGLALHQQAGYIQSPGLHATPLATAEVYGTKDH